LGTGALTTRGFNGPDFERIADYLLKSIVIGKRIQEKTGKKLVDFEKALKDDEEIKQIAVEVNTWAKTFSLPGQ
jgi:glycine hydroxymethyltransferase